MSNGNRFSTPLVGRSEELATLVDALEQAEEGGAQPVFIEGEAGIGKTRLICEALEEANQRGFEIWTGAADEIEQDRPFGPLIEALQLRRGAPDRARAEIGDLISASATDTDMVPASLRERLIEDIISVIESYTSERSGALVLEDLHWADPATVSTLRRLLRRATLARLAVVVSFRSSTVTNYLVGETTGARRISLGPLGMEATTELVTYLLDAVPGPRLLAESAKAAGNPLFVTELVGALKADDLITVRSGVAEISGGDLPRSLRLLIVRKLSFLSEETLDVLRVAAVFGSFFTVSDLSAATDRRASDLIAVLQGATMAGLLRPRGEHLIWSHDLVRDTIYQDLSLSTRKALHLQLAQTLARSGVDALKVAAHYSIGASQGNQDAVTWLRKAARDAAPRDAAIQAELLERALLLVPRGRPEYQELKAELAEALMWSGRVADAEHVARGVLEDSTVPEVLDGARSVLSLSLFFQNRMGEAGAEFEAAADDPLTPEASRLNLLAQAAMGYLQGGDPARAVNLAGRVVSLGEETGNHFATAIGSSVQGWVSYFSSHVGQSIESQRVAAAEADLDPTGEAHRRHPFLSPASCWWRAI